MCRSKRIQNLFLAFSSVRRIRNDELVSFPNRLLEVYIFWRGPLSICAKRNSQLKFLVHVTVFTASKPGSNLNVSRLVMVAVKQTGPTLQNLQTVGRELLKEEADPIETIISGLADIKEPIVFLRLLLIEKYIW